jgi:undecaprenyl-phosphate galactose phosphotransferase
MALVGPKPRTPVEVEAHEELRVLFDLVRPGMTGLWRIHSHEDLTLEEEVSLSLSTLQNQSPVEDLKILLRTFAPAKTTPVPRRRDL